MAVEGRKTIFGVIPLGKWKPATDESLVCLDFEEISHELLIGKERIIEDMRVGLGGAITVVISIKQESGRYQRSTLAYTPDEIDDLNKMISVGPVRHQFRNNLPKSTKHF